MIGNDVIDLALARRESDWRRKGWLEKLFTEWERARIGQAKNPELMVWTMWSQKESVYKIFNRLTGIRLFCPLRFECHENYVRTESLRFSTYTEITGDLLHTVAVLEASKLDEVREIQRSETLKRGDLPFAEDGALASISHHGRFEKAVKV